MTDAEIAALPARIKIGTVADLDKTKRPKYVVIFKDRYGNERIYARYGGKKAALRGPLLSPDFWADYAAWLDDGLPGRRKMYPGTTPGSYRALCETYFASEASAVGSLYYRMQKRKRLESLYERLASHQLSALTASKLAKATAGRDDKGLIESALRGLFRFGRQMGLIERSPLEPKAGDGRRISKRMRFFVLRRDGFRCVYCGRGAPTVELHCDHARPFARGGKTNAANLVTACADCNLGKSDLEAEAPLS